MLPVFTYCDLQYHHVFQVTAMLLFFICDERYLTTVCVAKILPVCVKTTVLEVAGSVNLVEHYVVPFGLLEDSK
jgi:hypothetical protein